LSLLPIFVFSARAGGARAVASALALFVVPAEIGRRMAGGTRVFPASAAIAAPVWICERAVASWLAVGARAVLGGVPYRGRILRTAATPMRELRRRHGGATAPVTDFPSSVLGPTCACTGDSPAPFDTAQDVPSAVEGRGGKNNRRHPSHTASSNG
jgi:hypothetical protein